MFLCSLVPYNNSSKLVRWTRDLATSLEENKFILFPIKQRKFICLHLPEDSSKDRVLYFTQIAQFIIYRYRFDVELLKKFIVKNPGEISLQFVWKRQLLNPRKVPQISGKNKRNRQINVAPEADIAKLNFPIFLKRVIFCSDFLFLNSWEINLILKCEILKLCKKNFNN